MGKGVSKATFLIKFKISNSCVIYRDQLSKLGEIGRTCGHPLFWPFLERLPRTGETTIAYVTNV